MTPRSAGTERRARARAGNGGVRVLVVDDQHVFRQAARRVIEATPRFELSGEACSGPDALATADELELDLVLVDVRMPGMDGIETAAALTAAHPDVVVVLISVEEPPNVPGGVGTCGAAELIRKRDFGPSLLRRLWTAHGTA